MAIYSLHMSSVGRSTHAPGTAGAHASYITRSKACVTIDGERMPLAMPGSRGGRARAWLNEQEAADRKNARVIDKVMVALPIELGPGQQKALVREFAEEITQGRASWMVAFHNGEADADNPHAHLIIRDRDFENGTRVAQLSEKGSVDKVRELWERLANEHLARAGRDARIDRRSLKDQGANPDRIPQIHVGPKPKAIFEIRGTRPQSQVRAEKKRPTERDPAATRTVDWVKIDGNWTREDVNGEIIAFNAVLAMKMIANTRKMAATATTAAASQAEALEVEAKEREHAAILVRLEELEIALVDAKAITKPQQPRGGFLAAAREAIGGTKLTEALDAVERAETQSEGGFFSRLRRSQSRRHAQKQLRAVSAWLNEPEQAAKIDEIAKKARGQFMVDSRAYRSAQAAISKFEAEKEALESKLEDFDPVWRRARQVERAAPAVVKYMKFGGWTQADVALNSMDAEALAMLRHRLQQQTSKQDRLLGNEPAKALDRLLASRAAKTSGKQPASSPGDGKPPAPKSPGMKR
jgi:hypothetical protein